MDISSSVFAALTKIASDTTENHSSEEEVQTSFLGNQKVLLHYII